MAIMMIRLKFHDCYSDPLGWISNSSSRCVCYIATIALSIITPTSAVDSFPVRELLQHEILSNSGVLIDNVSSLITRYHGYTALCRWIHQIGETEQ